ncbi:AIPR protein [Kineothrix alysoides]|uniref:AIPR protein n=1 Tax=Kineothrix alysoides TaxID=1469948 RepID=A0A4V2QC43_9FIRM|nr:AIPR family protein [Kineothrix alysoides]TCL58877.1 AIPR protein [Kineothrix alysoides]
MDLLEYREYYINQIKATAIEEERYAHEVFIDLVSEIMVSDWSLLSSIDQCHFSVPTGTRAFKSMLIHAGSLELSTNTINLLYADFNSDEIASITNTDISTHSAQMINFVENALKGYFSNGEQSNPAVQLGLDIKKNAEDIYKVNLFIVSTNQLSKRVKNIDLDDVQFQGKTYKVELDVIDMEKIYNAQLANTKKEDIIIKVTDFGTEGIPCIRADIGSGRYEAYLAVVPGEFLSNIYKKFGPRLLERNVRSFLQLRGGVNKGIRATILNESENFFSYNNGISTTAKSVTIEDIPCKGHCITSFTDFQIINGGQTTASLASASIKDNAPLDRILVQMKLTVTLDEGEEGDEFIRNTSQYANSQNKVTAADLVSNHQFYLRIEEFSRKLYAPPSKGLPYQTIWFFERSRGQYEQPKMKMTKGERATYERINPSNQRFDKKDLARYINSAEMLPYHVSWGGEINSVRFQTEMEKQWKADPSVFNESYFRDLIAKAILFSTIRKTILKQDWYKERNGYLIQNVTYAFAKLIYEVQKFGLFMNYRYIWDKQELPEFLIEEIMQIAYITREVFFRPNIGNVETYCKKSECWEQVKQLSYELSVLTKAFLVSKDDIHDEKSAAKKNQKFIDGISIEVDVFNFGADYWDALCEIANSQGVINGSDFQTLKLAAEYCAGKRGLPQFQFKRIMEVREKIRKAQIPV